MQSWCLKNYWKRWFILSIKLEGKNFSQLQWSVFLIFLVFSYWSIIFCRILFLEKIVTIKCWFVQVVLNIDFIFLRTVCSKLHKFQRSYLLSMFWGFFDYPSHTRRCFILFSLILIHLYCNFLKKESFQLKIWQKWIIRPIWKKQNENSKK